MKENANGTVRFLLKLPATGWDALFAIVGVRKH